MGEPKVAAVVLMDLTQGADRTGPASDPSVSAASAAPIPGDTSTLPPHARKFERYPSDGSPDEPVLPLEPLSTVTSLEHAKQLYAEVGMQFGTIDALVRQIKIDWGYGARLLLKRADQLGLPEEYPATSCSIDGEQYNLVGMVHSLSTFADVRGLLLRRLANMGTHLAEQNLGLLNLGMHSQGLDIPDHFARGFWRDLLFREQSLFGSAYTAIRLKALNFREKLPALRPSTELGGKIEELERKYRLPGQDPTLARISVLLLHAQADIMSPLPAAIRLDLKHQREKAYTFNEARSAYQAEFLRAWKPAETFRGDRAQMTEAQWATLTGSKGFLCGHAHTAEVEFFLRHGSREPAVTLRAQRDAAMLNRDVQEYMKAIALRTALAGFVTAVGNAAVVGLSTWAFGKWFFSH